MPKEFGEKEFREAINANMPDPVDVFYKLKQFKTAYVKQSTSKAVALCIALKRCGLPINSNTLSYLRKKTQASTLFQLHTLGDKHILVSKRRIGKQFEWVLNPLFLKLWEPKEDE